MAGRFEETFSLLANGEFNEITGHSQFRLGLWW